LVKPDFNKNALLLKQYLRLIPAKLGLINYGAFKMQINEIKKDDLFLVSYPKSGNTWLRYILATAMKGRSDFSFEELEEIIPDVYVSKNKINAKTNHRIIKSHDPVFNYLPSVIYIYRDYRDVLVSYYHYTVNANQFNGTISQFIESDFPDKYFGSWVDHLTAAFESKRKGNRILLLSYEDMLQNPELNISKILHFADIKSSLTTAQIAELCNFTNLQATEKSKGSYFGNEALFFRKGEANEGKASLSMADMKYILSNAKVKKLMDELGYIN